MGLSAATSVASWGRESVKRVIRSAGFRVVRIRPTREQLASHTTVVGGPIPPGKELHYRFGAWTYTVPMDKLVGRPCFGYSATGWHPFVAAVREFVSVPGMTYRASILSRFFDGFQPATIAEAQFPGLGSPCRALAALPAGSLFEPWLLREPPYDDPTRDDCRPPGSRLFGPVTREEGEVVFERLRSAYRSIKQYGYRPDLFPRGWIGIIVLRHEGEERYLVVHGQHRAAVLSAIGTDPLTVRVQPGLPPIVDSSDVMTWPHVVSGLVPPDCAVATLARYFDDDGLRCAGSLGLEDT